MQLVWPSAEHLPSYVQALKSGWSPDSTRGAQAAAEQLASIAADPAAFLATMVDRAAKDEPIKLPDGRTAQRLPGLRRWMWDGEFCGTIGLRWQPGTEALPPHCLGHIGYTVVPHKRRLGYATQALRDTLPLAKAEGLRYVEISTDHDNLASKRTIEVNGGVLVEHFAKPAAFGGTQALRYRIDLI